MTMRNLSHTRQGLSIALALLLTACGAPGTQPPLDEGVPPRAPATTPPTPAEPPIATAPQGPTAQPTHIALMLPLSGKLASAGQQLREGFFQAYYQARANGASVPVVDIIDENATPDLRAACQQAAKSGTQLVIGPLAKEHLRQLQQGGALPLPVLALNQVEDLKGENLYQFSLGVEDEARQLAELMRPRVANVLLLRGQDELSSRAARSFRQRWTELQGSVLGDAVTGDANASAAVKDALGIAGSESRGKAMEALLQHPVAFEPRPRAEIEAIVLLMRPNQAQLVVPTLALYGARQLPVAATSLSNAGGQNRVNADLEGLYILETPQVLASPSQPAADQRLYAMGQDSYLLAMHLSELSADPTASIAGRTGNLQLSPEHHVHRSLPLARFKNGQVQRVEAFTP